MMVLKNYIGGEFVEPEYGEYYTNYEPAYAREHYQVPRSEQEDVHAAVKAAKRAQQGWATMPIAERSQWLHKLADQIEENLDAFALAESRDTGKPLHLAKTIDIPRSIANLRFFASAIVNFSTQAHVMENLAVNYTRRAPIGIVGCISPWNLPLYLFTWKIAPALAMGNCVIAKPSELTSYTAFKLAEVASDIKFPRGVLNIVFGLGPEAGQAIVDHPSIKAISFTGGTQTGKVIARSCAEQFKKSSLELGGKNPNIIFEDCDFDEAVTNSVRSAFTNQGEICLCGSRIFVQKSIYKKFRDAYVNQVQSLKVGMPEDDVDMGALISSDHRDKVLKFIEEAKNDGGTILCGGNPISNLPGYFVEPTVIEGLNYQCSINQREVFGPVVTLIPFEADEEVVEMANSTEYGLSATIWTNDVKRAHRVAHALEAGIIWVNCWLLRDLRTPFGGMKNSGAGREGGEEALRFFSEPQNICIKL